MTNEQLGGMCFSVIFAVIAFFITRELWCWYFKLNAMLEELRGIRAALERLTAPSAQPAPPRQPVSHDTAAGEWPDKGDGYPPPR